MLKKILSLLNDNHDSIIAAIVCIVIMLYVYGCQSQVRSIVNPEQKLTRAELQTEVDYLLSQARNKFEDLDRQDQIKLLLFEQAALFAETGTINPLGLVTTALSIFFVGFGLDQRRKKIEVIKTLNGVAANVSKEVA